jgi:hypothetical protein
LQENTSSPITAITDILYIICKLINLRICG